MAWIIFGVGFVVIGLAVAVALGWGGQMQAEPVLDHPRGRIPDGPVNQDFLDGLVVPRRMNGYDTGQVDRFLREWVIGTALPAEQARFDVRFRGYDMGVVDALLGRMGVFHGATAEPVGEADMHAPDPVGQSSGISQSTPAEG